MNFGAHFTPSIRDGSEARGDMASTRGRSRTSSHHEADVLETITSGDGVDGRGCNNSLTDSTDIPEGASSAGDVSHLPGGHRQQASALYPAIQMKLDSGSGLHHQGGESDALDELGALGEVGSMPFLGFDSIGDLSGVDETHPEFGYQESGGRKRSISYHDLDFEAPAESFETNDIAGGQGEKALEGGCDLGWGGSMMEPMDFGRERAGSDSGVADGEEEGEDGGEAQELEGRPQEVPDVEPNWTTKFLKESTPMFGRTKTRARTQSYYGDDEDITACIDGRPLQRRASTSIVDGADYLRQREANRLESLAYSSGGETTPYGVDGSTRGMSAQAALEAVNKRVVDSSSARVEGGRGDEMEAGEGGARESAGMTPSGAASSSAYRKLKPNEVQALKQGLCEPVSSRKYSSSDRSDLSSDSEADCDFSEDESPMLLAAYNPPHEGHPPPPGSPLGPLAIEHRPLTTSADGLSPRDSRGGTGGSIGTVAVSIALPGAISTSAQRRGQRVLPPGVDPFLSVPERVLSPPLSPRGPEAGAFGMRRDISSPCLTAGTAIAAAFSSHLPAPQHSPPRLPHQPQPPTLTPDEDEEEEEDEEEDEEEEEEDDDGNVGGDERMEMPIYAHDVPGAGLGIRASWLAGESRIEEEPEDEVDVKGHGDVFLGLPPATLDSLQSRGPQPSHVQEQSSHMAPVSLPPSPPAPPPTQLAPRPPPEPIAPSPPRPPTPDASAPPLPTSPAELAPTIGTPPQHGNSLLPSDASGHGISPGYISRSLIPPPHPPGSSRYWSGGGGGGSTGGGFGRAGSMNAGPFGSGGSATGFGGNGGGGISRLMAPGGPFRTNRPGYGIVGGYSSRGMYQPGSGGGNGQSSLYGSDPGSLRDVSAWTDHGLRGRANLQGFFSAGGGNRHMLRRGAPGQPAKKVKLLMLGDSGVGKSSLVERFTEDHFNPSTVGTFGVDFKLKEATINDEEVVVQVWDTAGQQRFHKITQAYYRGSHGIVLVYDVANPDTLNNIGYWMKSIRENARENADSKRVQICLVGNKVDLREEAGPDGEGNMVRTESGRRIADMYGADLFECSAKTGLGVQDAFMTVATKAFEMYLAKPATPLSTRSRRHRSSRKKHLRHHSHSSHGSDRERPPRSDATWSTTASPISATDAGEKFDMRHCASDVSEASTVSALSQASAPSGTMSVHTSSHSLPRANSFATGNSLASNSSSAGSPPMLLNPSADGVLQDFVASPSPSSFSPAAAPTALRALELSRAHSDQGIGQERERERERGGGAGGRGVGGVVGMFKGKQKKPGGSDGAGGVGGGAGVKKSGGDEVEDDSPTGTGTLSPLPGHQRSLGNASSLADMDAPYSPPVSPAGTSSASARQRDESSGLLERMFSGVSGGSASDAGSLSGEDGAATCGAGVGGHGQLAAGRTSQAHQRPGGGAGSPSSGLGSMGSGDIRSSRTGSGSTGTNNDGGTQSSKPKGRKPPRIPKTKGGDGGGAAGGSGGRRGCKVS